MVFPASTVPSLWPLRLCVKQEPALCPPRTGCTQKPDFANSNPSQILNRPGRLPFGFKFMEADHPWPRSRGHFHPKSAGLLLTRRT